MKSEWGYTSCQFSQRGRGGQREGDPPLLSPPPGTRAASGAQQAARSSRTAGQVLEQVDREVDDQAVPDTQRRLQEYPDNTTTTTTVVIDEEEEEEEEEQHTPLSSSSSSSSHHHHHHHHRQDNNISSNTVRQDCAADIVIGGGTNCQLSPLLLFPNAAVASSVSVCSPTGTGTLTTLDDDEDDDNDDDMGLQPPHRTLATLAPLVRDFSPSPADDPHRCRCPCQHLPQDRTILHSILTGQGYKFGYGTAFGTPLFHHHHHHHHQAPTLTTAYSPHDEDFYMNLEMLQQSEPKDHSQEVTLPSRYISPQVGK